MSWDRIPHQPRVVEILRRTLKNGRGSHAYLFSGPTGAGKLRAAIVLAQALNCLESPDDPCGLCLACTKIARSEDPENVLHPDLVHLRAEKEGGPIRVAQIRAFIGSFAHAPLEARHRVVLIHEADRLNLDSQNTLLKTLEEPAEGLRTVFVLLTSRPHQLLDTIHSRVRVVPFDPVSLEIIERHLVEEKGIDPAKARIAAALSSGGIARAVELAQGPWIEGRDAWLEAWVKGSRGAVEAFEAEVRDARGKVETSWRIDLLQSWYRDVFLLALGADERLVINRDLIGRLREEAQRIGAARAAQKVEELQSLRETLEFNVRGDLGLENLLSRETASGRS